MADETTPAPEAQPSRVFLRDKYGRRFSIGADKAEKALSQGFRSETADETHEANLQAKYGDTAGEVKAGLAGLARGATAGLSDVALTKTGLVDSSTLSNLKEANPASSLAGEIGGAVGSLAIPGVGEASIPGLVAKAGAGAVERLGGGIAAHAAGAALEGGLFGIGNTLSDSALGDTPVTAQKLVAGAGLGALLGGGIGAAGSSLTKALAPAFEKLGSKLEQVPEMAQEAAAGRALKAAGFSKATLKGLGTTETDMLEGGQALLNSKLNNGTRLIEAGDRPADVLAKVEIKSDELGESIGAALKKVDESGAKFDMGAFVNRAREQLVAPLANDPAHENEAKALVRLLDGYEANATDSFAEANKLKSGLGKKISKWDPTDTIQAERRKLYGILNDEIEGQVGEAGGPELKDAFQQDKQLYGVMQAARKAGNTSVRGELGNRFLSPSDHGIGVGAALMHGGPGGIALGLAAAGANKVAREYGPAVFARGLDELANAPWFKSAAEAFTNFAQKQMDSQGPGIFSKYAPVLSNAIARGPEEALLTHAALSQTEPDYRNVMAGAGLDYTQSGADVAAKAHALALLRAHLDKHDATAQQAAAAALRGEGTPAAQAAMRSPLLGDSAAGPLKDWRARTDALRALAQNPDAITQKLAAALGPMASMAPQLATAMSSTAAQAVAFLNSKLPTSTDAFASIPALARPAAPSLDAQARFQRYVEAVSNPGAVFDAMARGHVSKEAVEALQAVYPDLHADWRQKVVAALGTHKETLPLARRVALGHFMGQPMDSSAQPARFMALQALHSAAGAQPPTPGGQGGHPRNRELKPPKDSAQQQMTYSQRVESR